MRRLVALLVVALVVWVVVQRESASTSGSAPAVGTWTVPDARTPVTPSGAERDVGASQNSAQRAANGSDVAPTSSRSSGKGFRDRAHLDDHFAKHGGEFAGLSKTQYLVMAQTLRDAPVGGNILEITRASDGVVSRFDKRSGAFLAFDRDGTIRTFFKPNDGEKYFRRQANRTPTP